MTKPAPWPQLKQHMIMLGLVWTAFSVIYGLMGAFSLMEASLLGPSQAFLSGLGISVVLIFAGLLTLAVSIWIYKRWSNPTTN